MKKFAGKALKVMKLAAAAGAFLFCLTDTAAASRAVAEGAERCIYIVIPSLFAMMAVSGIIVRSGITGLLPRAAGRLGRLIFGMEETVLPIFTFGMFAGYPVGVKMLCDEYSAGNLTKRRAELLSGLCFGAGPAFIFGCLSVQLYSSDRAGLIILFSAVAANVLLAAAMSGVLRKTASEPRKRRSVCISGEMLTDSILKSGRSMADICIMITAFSVITEMLDRIGVIAAAGELLSGIFPVSSDTGGALARAFLDITNISGLPSGDASLLPYISALVSFGGVCVIFQLSALAAGRLSLRPFMLTRCAAAVLSFVICSIIMPHFYIAEAVEVSTLHLGSGRVASPVPSFMLILMTLMLLRELGGRSSESEKR